MDDAIKMMKERQNSHTGKQKIETLDISLANNKEGKLMNHNFSDNDNHYLSKAGSVENIVNMFVESLTKLSEQLV